MSTLPVIEEEKKNEILYHMKEGEIFCDVRGKTILVAAFTNASSKQVEELENTSKKIEFINRTKKRITDLQLVYDNFSNVAIGPAATIVIIDDILPHRDEYKQLLNDARDIRDSYRHLSRHFLCHLFESKEPLPEWREFYDKTKAIEEKLAAAKANMETLINEGKAYLESCEFIFDEKASLIATPYEFGNSLFKVYCELQRNKKIVEVVSEGLKREFTELKGFFEE
jgi:hypothetical protein